jgi:hypothetical protein
MWDLWWTKWRWDRFFPITSVSPANIHSTNFSTITLTYHFIRGWYNRPVVAAVPKAPPHKKKKIVNAKNVSEHWSLNNDCLFIDNRVMTSHISECHLTVKYFYVFLMFVYLKFMVVLFISFKISSAESYCLHCTISKSHLFLQQNTSR